MEEDVSPAGVVVVALVAEGVTVMAASPVLLEVLWVYLQGAVVEEEEGRVGAAGFASVVELEVVVGVWQEAVVVVVDNRLVGMEGELAEVAKRSWETMCLLHFAPAEMGSPSVGRGQECPQACSI